MDVTLEYGSGLTHVHQQRSASVTPASGRMTMTILFAASIRVGYFRRLPRPRWTRRYSYRHLKIVNLEFSTSVPYFLVGRTSIFREVTAKSAHLSLPTCIAFSRPHSDKGDGDESLIEDEGCLKKRDERTEEREIKLQFSESDAWGKHALSKMSNKFMELISVSIQSDQGQTIIPVPRIADRFPEIMLLNALIPCHWARGNNPTFERSMSFYTGLKCTTGSKYAIITRQRHSAKRNKISPRGFPTLL